MNLAFKRPSKHTYLAYGNGYSLLTRKLGPYFCSSIVGTSKVVCQQSFLRTKYIQFKILQKFLAPTQLEACDKDSVITVTVLMDNALWQEMYNFGKSSGFIGYLRPKYAPSTLEHAFPPRYLPIFLFSKKSSYNFSIKPPKIPCRNRQLKIINIEKQKCSSHFPPNRK